MMNPMRPMQGMDTGAQNPEELIRALMNQQMQQGPQTTPIGQRIQDPRIIPQNPNAGSIVPQAPQSAMFNQNAQPALGSIAPRNQIPQQMGPSSPLQDMYKVPPSLAR